MANQEQGLRLQIPYLNIYGSPNFYTSMKRVGENIELIDSKYNDEKITVETENMNHFECFNGHYRLIGEYDVGSKKWDVGLWSLSKGPQITKIKDKEGIKSCARFFNAVRNFYLSNEHERDNLKSLSLHTFQKTSARI